MHRYILSLVGLMFLLVPVPACALEEEDVLQLEIIPSDVQLWMNEEIVVTLLARYTNTGEESVQSPTLYILHPAGISILDLYAQPATAFGPARSQ
jgi:hypothetical protein